MDRLEAMTILLAAVDSGSLSAASRHLGTPLATVSRRISELEEHLKVRLLLRGNRKLVLTDAGRDYVASCRRIMEEIAEVERTASGEYRAPQGELSISVPKAMGRIVAMPIVVEFQRAFPDVRMRVQLEDRQVNLLEEHIDVALRVGAMPDSSMIATRVGAIWGVLCASPSYLKGRRRPETPADLASHDWVAYDGFMVRNNWPFNTGGVSQWVDMPGRLVVNSIDAAIAAAVAGAGITGAALYQIEELVKSGALVRLLEAYEVSPMPVNLVYPSQRQMPVKLRAFLDFAVPRLRDRLGYK